MKNGRRPSLRLMSLFAALALTFGLAACGGESASSEASSAESREAVSSAVAASSSAASSEAASSEAAEESSEPAAATGSFATVEEYLADPAMKEQLDSIAEALEGSGMTMTIEAEGNALVYDYTFTTEMDGATRDATVSALEEALSAQADTFSSVASALQQAVDTDGVSVIVRYRDSNGDILTEQTFPAN